MIDNQGHSGGLTLFWKEKQWARVPDSSKNFIDVEVQLEGMDTWRLISAQKVLF